MVRALAVLVLAACCSGTASADWIADADVGLFHDSNLNNAELKRDVRSDAALSAALSAGRFFPLSRDWSLTLTADARSVTHRHYSGMNNLSAGTTLAVRRKLGLGHAAPWLRMSASAARLEFDDNVRDGWLYRAALAGGQRLAQRWDVQAQYSLEKRTGDQAAPAVRSLPGDVFDLSSHSLTLDVRYGFSERTLLFAAYSRRDGDVVSTSSPNAKIFRATSAITRDPVFGANSFAYKLDATSHVVSFGVSHAMSSRSALNVSYERQITHAAGDNNYFKNVFAASYSHRFF